MLTAPRSLTATPTNLSGQIRLTWTAPLSNGGSAITDYIIQRSPNGSTGWVTITDGVSTTTGYTVTGLTNGTRYYFRVFARNGDEQQPGEQHRQRHPAHHADRAALAGGRADQPVRPDPPDLAGPGVERWLGDHRLHHPTLTERHDELDDDQRRRQHHHRLHRDRTDQRHPLLLPGLRPQRRRATARRAPSSARIPHDTVPGRCLVLRRVRRPLEGFYLYWGDPVSTGGSPITGFVIQAYDYDTGSWFTFGYA